MRQSLFLNLVCTITPSAHTLHEHEEWHIDSCVYEYQSMIPIHNCKYIFRLVRVLSLPARRNRITEPNMQCSHNNYKIHCKLCINSYGLYFNSHLHNPSL